MSAVLLGVIVLLSGACVALWQRGARGAPPTDSGGPLDLQREHVALAHRFTNDAVLLLDTQGRILDANDRALELYGHSFAELGALGFAALRAPDESAEDPARDGFAAALSQDAVVYETEHRHRDGRILPVEVSARRFELEGNTYVQCFVRDVSDRRRAEQALRESERRFREFVEKASDIVFGLDREGRFTYITPNVADILGRAPAEFTGQAFDFVVHPEDRAEVRGALRRVGSPEDRHRTTEYRVLDPAGSVRWHSARVSPLRDADGRIRAYTGIARDITDRRLAELHVQRSERRLRDAQRLAHVGSWEAHPQSGRMIWSEETYRIYGVTPETFDGTVESFLALVHPEDRDAMLRNLERRLAGEEVVDEFRCVRPDGSVRHLSGRGQVIRDPAGGIGAVIGTVQDVTERLGFEEQMRANESRYRSLFEHASDVIFLVDEDGRFVDVNPAGEALFGYSRDELLGMGVPDLLAPGEHARFAEEYRATLAGRPQRTRWRHRRKDGAILHVEVSSSRLDDGRVLAVLRDQTATMAAQREIEHQRNLFDLLAQCNEAIVHGTDLHELLQTIVRLAVDHGRFMFAFFGEVSENGSVRPVAIHGEDQGYVEQLRINVLDAGPAGQGPLARSIVEGRPVLVQDFLAEGVGMPWHEAAQRVGIGSAAAFPVRQGGRVVGGFMLYAVERGFFSPSIVQTLEEMVAEIGFALDTIATRAELEEQRHLMRSILDADPAAIYAYDLEGRLLLGNATWLRLFGGSLRRVVGRRREDFMEADLAREHRASDLEVIAAGESRLLEESVRGRTYATAKFPLRDLAGRLYAVGGVSSDITDVRRMQQEIVAANRDLEAKVVERTAELTAAKEMAEAADRAKSAFLATMSHELRSPLNSIIGFTSILLEGLTGPLNDGQRKQLQIVNDSSRHLLAIINDLLDISRIEAGSLEIVARPFLLQPVIERVLGRFTLQARQKGIEFGQAGAACAETVCADERRVEQIVANLVSNAVKFTDQGSVRLRVHATAEELRVAIEDTGPGIAPADQGRLFQHFSQLKPRDGKLREGTGLGLAISDRLARAMGGRILLESRVGAGSTFTLLLPWGHDPGL